jgi:flavin-dependent dehydrogenase
MESREELTYDLILIGGGISATFLCLDIFKKDPNFKILIIENSTEFAQKVGESVVDITALILERKGIGHLLNSQTTKSGIRFLFNEQKSKDISDLAEFASPTLHGRIKGYHLDRKKLDQDLLDEVERRGVKVLRPAEVKHVEKIGSVNHVSIQYLGESVNVASRWIVDASGRARFMAKKMNWADKKIGLQTASIMTHFRNIQPNKVWDTPDDSYWEKNAIAPRKYSTTHIMRPNSWWWIIRLDETTTSIGVMYDKNKVNVESPEDYFLHQIKNDPELSKMTDGAEMSTVRYLEQVPYVCEKMYDEGVALIGDSGAFMDPLFSPGLELIGQQCLWVSELLVREKESGTFDQRSWKKYETNFFKAYDTRLLMYKYAYGIMGSYDLFTTWTKLGNFVYLGTTVYPAVVFKKRLRIPLQFSIIEKIGVKLIGARLNKIYENRLQQHRFSNTKKHHLEYSGFHVPWGIKFLYKPLLLLGKAIRGYVSLELNELFKRKKRSVHQGV